MLRVPLFPVGQFRIRLARLAFGSPRTTTRVPLFPVGQFRIRLARLAFGSPRTTTRVPLFPVGQFRIRLARLAFGSPRTTTCEHAALRGRRESPERVGGRPARTAREAVGALTAGGPSGVPPTGI